MRQQQSFSPYAFYVRIAVIVTSATPLSGAPLITRRSLMRPVVHFPVAGLDARRAHIPTHRPLLPLPEDTLRFSPSIPVSAKTWCMRLSAVPATNYIGETGRRLGDRFRENLRSTRLSGTDLPVGRHFTSPGHSIGDMLVSVIRSGFRSPTERRVFEARMIFRRRILQPAGLNVDFNFV